VVRAVLIDQLNRGVADFIVGARPVFGGSGRGSIRTANGLFSKVVNEGDSLKEYGSAGKRTRILARQKHQMRGILVTPDNVCRRRMFGPAHIEGMAVFRKRYGAEGGYRVR
jgi:hypothetical protein